MRSLMLVMMSLLVTPVAAHAGSLCDGLSGESAEQISKEQSYFNVFEILPDRTVETILRVESEKAGTVEEHIQADGMTVRITVSCFPNPKARERMNAWGNPPDNINVFQFEGLAERLKIPPEDVKISYLTDAEIGPFGEIMAIPDCSMANVRFLMRPVISEDAHGMQDYVDINYIMCGAGRLSGHDFVERFGLKS